LKDEGVTTWVKPSLVAQVKFAEWTSKGELASPGKAENHAAGVKAAQRDRQGAGKSAWC
jgi:ATP-dependent DNA ligase